MTNCSLRRNFSKSFCSNLYSSFLRVCVLFITTCSLLFFVSSLASSWRALLLRRSIFLLMFEAAGSVGTGTTLQQQCCKRNFVSLRQCSSWPGLLFSPLKNKVLLLPPTTFQRNKSWATINFYAQLTVSTNACFLLSYLAKEWVVL